jgi:molybdate transport system substrate-binding protein
MKTKSSLSITAISLGLLIIGSAWLLGQPTRKAEVNSVNVFAASSLQVQYTALAAKFEASNNGVKINLSFGPSDTLASQIIAGAPVDIFVSADGSSMEKAKSEFSNISEYVVNRVVLAFPISSQISTISDLNKEISWVQCAVTAPCGIAATNALSAEGGVSSSPVSFEASASSTLAKLLSGSVDAAIVYRTDVIANAADVRAIEFSNLNAASTQYWIGFSKKSIETNSSSAYNFLNYLKSPTVLKALAKAGFQVDSLK